MPDLFFQLSLDLPWGKVILFSTRERKNGENWSAFVYNMWSLPFISKNMREKGGVSPKGFPAMCVCAQLTCWRRA